MFKLLSTSQINYYKLMFANANMMERYGCLTEWKTDAVSEICSYYANSKCVIYGSKALEFAVAEKYRHKKVSFNDVDVYSSRPRVDVNALFELLSKKPYCWCARVSRTKNKDTYVLFLNELKILDVTYMDPDTLFSLAHKRTADGINYCLPHLTLMDNISVLSDHESVYMLRKAVEKIELIESMFPLLRKNLSNIPPVWKKELVEQLTSILSRPVKSSINYVSTLISSPEIEVDSAGIITSTTDIRSMTQTVARVAGTRADFPYFYSRVVIPQDYFFSGSVAMWQYAKAFNVEVSCPGPIDIYVSDVNDFVQTLISGLKCNIALSRGPQWSCMFVNSVRLELKSGAYKGYDVWLFESARVRPYLKLDGLNFSCVTMLKAQLLMRALLLDKQNYSKYIHACAQLSDIAYSNQNSELINPDSRAYLLMGMMDMQRRSNEMTILHGGNQAENVLEGTKGIKHVSDQETEDDDFYKININYTITE